MQLRLGQLISLVVFSILYWYGNWVLLFFFFLLSWEVWSLFRGPRQLRQSYQIVPVRVCVIFACIILCLLYPPLKHAMTHHRGVLTLGLPDSGWSAVQFVWRKRPASLGMVLWVQFNLIAISLTNKMTSKSPVNRPLLSGLNPGMLVGGWGGGWKSEWN